MAVSVNSQIASPSSLKMTGTLAQRVAFTGWPGLDWFDTTYNAWFSWSVDRWWPRGAPDPRYGYIFYDEFFGTDRIGALDWNNNSGTLTTASGATSIPGAYLLRIATASSNANMRSSLAAFLFGGADYYIESKVQFPTAATSGEDFCGSFGFNDSAAYSANGDCTDGAYFTYNRAVNGANWVINTMSNGTKTATNTSTAIVAATDYRIGILVSATNSNVVFSVNGTVVGTHTTNIPTGAGRQTGIQWKVDKTAGSANSDMQVDYFGGYGFFTGGGRVA